MAVKFFGQYLLEKGVVSNKALIEAIERQKKTNIALGELAVEKGYLTAGEATQINNEQRTTDRRFGEIALEERLITEEELNDLIETQKSQRVFLGEALVEAGHLTKDELDRYLHDYQEEQRKGEVRIDVDLGKVDNRDIVWAYVSVTTKLFLRLIQEQIKIVSVDVTDRLDTEQKYIFMQKTNGDMSFEYGLAVNEKALLEMAKFFFDEEKTVIDEYVEDSAKEFLNIISGNTMTKLSMEGLKMGLEPPVRIDHADQIKGAALIHVRLAGTKGDADLFFKF